MRCFRGTLHVHSGSGYHQRDRSQFIQHRFRWILLHLCISVPPLATNVLPCSVRRLLLMLAQLCQSSQGCPARPEACSLACGLSFLPCWCCGQMSKTSGLTCARERASYVLLSNKEEKTEQVRHKKLRTRYASPTRVTKTYTLSFVRL